MSGIAKVSVRYPHTWILEIASKSDVQGRYPRLESVIRGKRALSAERITHEQRYPEQESSTPSKKTRSPTHMPKVGRYMTLYGPMNPKSHPPWDGVIWRYMPPPITAEARYMGCP